MAWAPPALPLPAVRVAAAPARPLPRVRPARAHLLLAACAPPRPASPAQRACSSATPSRRLGTCVTNSGAPRALQRRCCAPGDVHGPAVDALKGVAVDAFRPLMDNFGQVFSLKNAADVNDYNIGMPFGCYQLFKIHPSTFLDVVLGYAFYKLSVLSSQVHRQGFVNDLITKIKVAIIAIILIKDIPSSNPDSPVWVFIRVHVFHLYLTTFYFATKGWKQEARYVLFEKFEALRRELARILFEPDI